MHTSLYTCKFCFIFAFQVIELPIKHPELFDALGIAQPKGVLLYGPVCRQWRGKMSASDGHD